MSDETMEKIVIVPPQWKIGGVREGEVYVGVAGQAPATIPLSQFDDGALRQLRAILLGKIHRLVQERASIYKDIAEVNGELDRRKNDSACRNNTPPTPSQEGGSGVASQEGRPTPYPSREVIV